MPEHRSAGPGAPTKPAGGYALIPARQLAALCRAHTRGQIRLIDLRAALAAREMTARRDAAGLGTGRAPSYTLAELASLTGSTPKHLRPALARLGQAGLLHWAVDAIEFPEPGDDPAFGAWLAGIANNRRRVPVPRRMLRALARATGFARVATVLGTLFRCVYVRGRALALRGRIKASWVALTFGVDIRRVRDARAELVRSGWLVPERGDAQAAMNRWGRAYAVDPDWAEPAPAGGPEMTPPPSPPGPGMAPPIPDRDPLPRAGHQEPGPAGGDGACAPGQGGARLPRPDLRRVRAEDLADAGRTLELYRQAAGRGLVSAGESGRLRVMAAAEHARSSGRSNPPGLFAAVLRRGLWGYITGAEEDAAGRRLKRHLHGPPPVRPSGVPTPPAVPAGPSLSADAELVRQVRSRVGRRADAYLVLRRHSGGWTRERYDNAASELEVWALRRPPVAEGGLPGLPTAGWALLTPAPLTRSHLRFSPDYRPLAASTVSFAGLESIGAQGQYQAGTPSPPGG